LPVRASVKPEALQNTAVTRPKFGVLALATALDDVGSGTRRPSSSRVFLLHRDPKLRQAGSTPKHSRFATQVWSAGACALATALDGAGSGTRRPSRSDEFPLRRSPKLRQAGALQNTAASPPKLGVLAACALATALDYVSSGTRSLSRSHEFPFRRDPKLRQAGALQNTAAPPPKLGVLALATALDDVGSGTRPPSRSYEIPLRQNPKLRQAGSTPKHGRFAT